MERNAIPNSWKRVLANTFLGVPVSVLTLKRILEVKPLQYFLGTPPIVLLFSDDPLNREILLEMTIRQIAPSIAVVYSMIGVYLCEVAPFHSATWWKWVFFLYVIFVLGVITGIICFMDRGICKFGVSNIDIILGPVAFLLEIEIVHLVRKLICNQ